MMAIKKNRAKEAVAVRCFDMSAELRATAERRKQQAEKGNSSVGFSQPHGGIPEITERLAALFPLLGLDVVHTVVSDTFHSDPHCSRELLASNAMAKLLEMSLTDGSPQSFTSLEPACVVHNELAQAPVAWNAEEQVAVNATGTQADATMESIDGFSSGLAVAEDADCIDEQLAALLALDDATLLTCARTLLSILRRIGESPQDARVRRLRQGNPRFRDEVGRHEAAVNLLRRAGFVEEAAEEGGPALVFYGNPSSSAVFLQVRNSLAGVLEVMQSSESPMPASQPAAKPASPTPTASSLRERIAKITEERLCNPRGFREAALARGLGNHASGSGLVIKADVNIRGSYRDDTWNKEVVVTQTGTDLMIDYGGRNLQGKLEGRTISVKGFRAVGTITSSGDIHFADGGHWTLEVRAKPVAAPSRRAQHFTMADIERLRIAEEIANMPSYAEEYQRAKHTAPVHNIAALVTRNYDPELLARQALDLTNRYRASKDLPPCRWHDGIASIAAEHARQMASGAATFSHDGFDGRVRAFPVAHRSAAENLAFNKGVANVSETAVDGWIKSPGHEKNLRGTFNLCGIGVAQASDGSSYITQLFALAI